MQVRALIVVGILAVAVTGCSGSDGDQRNDGAGTEEEQQQNGDDATLGREPLDISAPGEVGDWTVTLAAVELDATAEVVAAGEPEPVGQYVEVALDATFNGSGKSAPGFDLDLMISGGDGAEYDAQRCGTTDDIGMVELESGGTASFTACVDVSADALDEAVLVVQQSGSTEDESRRSWSLT